MLLFYSLWITTHKKNSAHLWHFTVIMSLTVSKEKKKTYIRGPWHMYCEICRKTEPVGQELVPANSNDNHMETVLWIVCCLHFGLTNNAMEASDLMKAKTFFFWDPNSTSVFARQVHKKVLLLLIQALFWTTCLGTAEKRTIWQDQDRFQAIKVRL